LESHHAVVTLTLEDVTAIKITDYDAITEAGINRAKVADRLLATYLKQIFEDGFFHADPHPGNIFHPALELKKMKMARLPKLTFIDFGMVGRMPEKLVEGLRETVIAVGLQDSCAFDSSVQMLGVLLPSLQI
jgi:predicted unusual protein kinase regulating ubiquinone biosynthesis (AarF/ABC1/UbiB family)